MKPSQTISPRMVAKRFVDQYYQHVSKDTLNLYRFYKDESTFTHGDGSQPEPAVSGMANIKEKISALGLANAQVNLDSGSVDAQRSKDGGVLLMVTGTMTIKTSKQPKQFVQTFFLAPQHQKSELTSFFVLNDTFRFLDSVAGSEDGKKMTTSSADDSAAHSFEATGDSAHTMAEDVPDGEEGGDLNTSESKGGAPGSWASLVAKPGSWASLVAKAPPAGSNTAAQAAPSSSSAKSSGEDALSGAPPVPDSATGGWGDDEEEEVDEEDDDGSGMNPSMKDPDQPCTSIYVKNFAVTTSEEQLQELFLRFGAIKNISVKPDRGFAFVDFQDPDSVQQVLTATPETFLVDGKRLVVEERQSRDSRGNFRGGSVAAARGGGRFVRGGGRATGRDRAERGRGGGRRGGRQAS